MFSWGEDWQKGFRLKKRVPARDGVHFLNLSFQVADLSVGHRVLAFVKSNGEASIIRTNEGPDGNGEKGKQKFVDCKEKIEAVSCGDDSVALLSEGGRLFCVDTTHSPFIPSTPKVLSNVVVSQVACGSKHTVVLTRDGQVFTWGQDSMGQLGLGGKGSGAGSPQQLRALSAIPVVHVAAGGEQSFALSVSGGVFGWGGNHCGQLGLGDTTDRHTPTPVQHLNMKKTVHVSCGRDHTAALTKDGEVFTFGSGQHGQLGHNSLQNELHPRLVAELWGAKVTKVACGSHHTLVLTDSGKIYSFGCDDQGQLGHGGESHSSVPLPVQLPQDTTNGHMIRNIYAGGHGSFADEYVNEDSNRGPKIKQTHGPVDDMINKWTSECDAKSQKNIKLEIHGMFSSASCLNRSFLDRSKDKHFQTSSTYSGLDLSLARHYFEKLVKTDFILKEVEAAVLQLLPSLDKKPVGMEGLRIFLLLNEFLHVIQKRKGQQSSKLAEEIAAAAKRLSTESLQIIVDWWSSLSPSAMVRHVEVWKNALSWILMFVPVPRNSVSNMLLILHNMYNANKRKKIPDACFCSAINQTFLQMDLQLWRSSRPGGTQGVNDPPLLLCSSACLLDLKSKLWVFQTNNAWTQEEHREKVFTWPWGLVPQADFFKLNLRREHLLEDAFAQLTAAPHKTLKKPLGVYFDGNTEHKDVHKRDFFHRLFDDMVLLNSGMFMFNDSKTLAWFPSRAPAEELQRNFYLFGILCGLALYNKSIIHLPFPLALFKKLLNVELTLEDMLEFSPTVGGSLQYVLDYKDVDLEDVGMFFTIEWDETEVELDPENPGKPVTNDNKKEFVDAYVNYAFNTSVEVTYQEFERGFFQVCDRHLIKLFRPEELKGVLVGQEGYDWEKLKRNTVYEWPFHPGHPTIQMFWKVFDKLNEDLKKHFFLFVTGFKKVPILGMDQIHMTVRVKHIETGSHDMHFPESLTCHSFLDLPLYSTKKIMKDRLIDAVVSKRGFSQE